MSPTTSGRNVARTRSLMRATASSPAAMLTPAASYVSPTGRCVALLGRDGDVDGGGDGDRAGVGAGRGAERHVDRVLARQTGGAEARARRPRGRHQPVEVEVGQR